MADVKQKLIDSFLKQLYKDWMIQRNQMRIDEGVDDILGFIADELDNTSYVNCIRLINQYPLEGGYRRTSIATEYPSTGEIALNLELSNRVNHFMEEHHFSLNDMITFNNVREWYDEVLVPELGLREILAAQSI